MSILDYFKVSAKHDQPKVSKSLGGQIIHETPADRQEDLIIREPLPTNVAQALDSAADGNLTDQGIIFNSMRDTMPRLQANMDEMCGMVSRNDIQVEPFSEPGKDPTTSAIDKAAFVKRSFDAMLGDHILSELDIQGTVYAIAEGFYEGHSALEILWRNDRTPKSTVKLPWRYIAYPDGTDTLDRLMLNPRGEYSLNNLVDFPPNKFIVAIKKGHGGHASQAAPLRALITSWLGVVYGNKWLLGFAQIFGIPLRWVTYAEGTVVSTITNMLKKIGASMWAAFPQGTKMEVKEATTSAGNLPQQALIDNANKAVDIFILGQTLTTDTSSSGSRSMGEMHNEIRLDRVDCIGLFCSKVISSDLVKPLLILNYGDDSEMPTITIKSKRSKDKKGIAETMKILTEAIPGFEFSEEQVRTDLDFVKPLNDEDKIVGVTPTEEPPAEEVEEEEEEIEASQATIRAAEAKATIDTLSTNVLEGLTDVSAEWLLGVKPFFDKIAALAISGHVTDEDFLNAVIQAKNQLPELFTKLDTKTLQEAFEKSSGTAMMAGVEDSLES